MDRADRIDNPMCSPAAIERHYRETEDPASDDYYRKCSFCQRDVGPLDMDMELDDVCNRCVAEVMKKARVILAQHMYHAEYDLFDRAVKTYADGAL